MSYALHDGDDEMIGFLLLTDDGENSGDFLFRAFPPSDKPVSARIQHLQDQGEFRWLADGERIRILSQDGEEIGFIHDGCLTIDEYCLPVVDMTGS